VYNQFGNIKISQEKISFAFLRRFISFEWPSIFHWSSWWQL